MRFRTKIQLVYLALVCHRRRSRRACLEIATLTLVLDYNTNTILRYHLLAFFLPSVQGEETNCRGHR